MERMEWVEDLDVRVFYAQSIVSVDGCNSAATRSSPSRKATTAEPVHKEIYATLSVPLEVMKPVRTMARDTRHSDGMKS